MRQMTVQDWLGKENQLGIDIWEHKYRQNNESFEAWLHRVSGGDEQVRQLILEKKFLFAGRILAGRGAMSEDMKVSLSNCYVVTPPEDSLESIYDCARRMARTYSYGGGCGVDISKLAPNGARIRNATKTTTGAVSFMDLFAMSTALIGQRGRRGALMISIDGRHPDLEEFIDVKQDLTRVTKANTSIRIHDDFMEAARDGKDYELSFTREATGETVRKTVDAKALLRHIAQNNWDMGEPGMIFWDRVSTWNIPANTPGFAYAGVNPCFSGDMRLLTADGYRTFEELAEQCASGESVSVVSFDGSSSSSHVWCSGEKETVDVTLSNGSVVTCTPDHIFMTADGDECPASALVGKRLRPFIAFKPVHHKPEYVKLGFIQGDGQLTRLNSENHRGVEVNLGKKDNDIRDMFINDDYTETGDRVIYLHGYEQRLHSLGFSQAILPERTMPASYSSWPIERKAAFLCGCYSANGSVVKHGRVSYKTTCRLLADELVATLRDDFGLHPYITTNKSTSVAFANGSYVCRESYDVNLGRFEDILAFALRIGFRQAYKMVQLRDMVLRRAPLVRSVVPAGKKKVYDFSEPRYHWGVVEGYIVHNCAEEPLPAGGACLLGSLNLAEFTEGGSFDFASFDDAVGVCVRALNDVLDEGLPFHPLDEQKQSAKEWRQIGLGLFGLADMHIRLKMKYGSPESLTLCDEIGSHMINHALRASAELARDDGVYPRYDANAVLSSSFLKANADETTIAAIRRYGLRNSQLLTIPPSGTISTMLGVSSGVEPIYANAYTRKTESVHGKDVYYKVYTPSIAALMKELNIMDENELPDYCVTAATLDHKCRVDMQAVWQKHIDASISSTVNLPEVATVEDIESIYRYAWEKGLKGITVFRDKCRRTGILTTGAPENQQTVRERPAVTTGMTEKVRIGCGNLYCTVNRDEHGLCEVFTSVGRGGGCPSQSEATSRLISIALRSGVKPETLIEQLRGIRCPSTLRQKGLKALSCPDAIGQVMEHVMAMTNSIPTKRETAAVPTSLIADTEPVGDSICPECGKPLEYEGGCTICKACGYSKCG